MPKPPISCFLRVCCLLIATAAGAQQFRLKPLSPTELSSAPAAIDKTLLPDGAKHVQVASRQSFQVQQARRTELTILPVHFSTSEAGLVPGIERINQQCGLYLRNPSGKSRYTAIGPQDTAIQCDGIEAVGLARDQAAHAQILLIYTLHTVHRSWSDPYLVSWNQNENRYSIEAMTPPASATQTPKLTISQLKHWLDRTP